LRHAFETDSLRAQRPVTSDGRLIFYHTAKSIGLASDYDLDNQLDIYNSKHPKSRNSFGRSYFCRSTSFKNGFTTELMSSLLYLLVSTFHETNSSYDITENLELLINSQSEDGSFLNPPSQECNHQPLPSKEVLENSFVETAQAILAIQMVKNFSVTEGALKLGIDFLNTTLDFPWPDDPNDNTNNFLDNYPLSIVTLALSRQKHQLAPKLFKMLNERISRDDSGLFWASTWKETRSCPQDPQYQRDFSIVATSYALMVYAERNHSDAFEIAKWLVAKRDGNGMYKSFADSAIALKSLHLFTKTSDIFKDGRVSLVHEISNCYGPFKNESNGNDFVLTVRLNKN